jgi:hypothetical protein
MGKGQICAATLPFKVVSLLLTGTINKTAGAEQMRDLQ